MAFSILDYYENALLALASYGLNLEGLTENQIVAKLVDEDMVEAQAIDFVNRYTVIDQMENTPNGASATVFSRDGQFFFAIRGTAPLADPPDVFGAGAEIYTYGIAITQLLDIYNYWLRLTAPAAGAHVYQYFYEGNRGLRSTYIIATGQGVLFGQQLTLTGHSLGGHLAVALSRLIPQAVNGVFAYNAPGFDESGDPALPGPAWFFSGLRVLEIDTTGVSAIASSYDVNKLQNIVVPEDSVLGLPGLGSMPGAQQDLFSEGIDSSSHSIAGITDSLGVHRLLSALSAGKSAQEVLALGLTISRAASNTLDTSLEALVNSLGSLFSAGTQIATGDRNELYGRITALNDELIELDGVTLVPLYTGISIVSLASIDATTLQLNAASPAANGIAYRYALHELNPFVITGNDSIYMPHNTGGVLDANNFTTEYIADRAGMLLAHISRNLQDTGQIVIGDRRANYTDVATGITVTTDPANGAAPASWPIINVKFGTTAGEPLAGNGSPLNEDEDHLYGDQGDDVLIGNSGKDYLEGGQGSDTLYGGAQSGASEDSSQDTLVGGAGNDTYYVGQEDLIVDAQGTDTLNIANGGGSLNVGGTYVEVSAGSGVYWNSSKKTTIYWKGVGGIGDARVLISTDPTNPASLTVKDFSIGRFGINLQGPSNETPSGAPITGTEEADIDNGLMYLNEFIEGKGGDDRLTGFTTYELQIRRETGQKSTPVSGGVDTIFGGEGHDYLASGNIYGFPGDALLDGFPEDDGDHFFGGAGKDMVDGGGGSDTLFGGTENDFLAGRGGADTIEGGDGDDALSGGDGADVLIGGAGSDHLNGRDWFPAEAPAEWGFDVSSRFDGRKVAEGFFVHTRFETDSDAVEPDKFYGGAGDDIIGGDGGEDVVYGEGDNDVIYGAEESDILFGGSGADLIWGDTRDESTPRDGNDEIHGEAGDDTVFGGAGGDRIYGGSDHDTLGGGIGSDTIYGGSGRDIISGEKDDDYLSGEGENDTIVGGEGDDFISGGLGDDQLHGGDGDFADVIYGGGGADYLFGGGGADLLAGEGGSDALNGSDGHDTYLYFPGNGVDSVQDSSGDDLLSFAGGITLDQVAITKSGSEFQFIIDAQNAVILKGDGIERVQFSDGRVLSSENFLNPLAAGFLENVTTSSASPIGSAGDDVINVAITGGSTGIVTAGAGNDVYRLQPNANVEITDLQGSNTLVFGNGAALPDLNLVSGGGGKFVISTANFSVTVSPAGINRYVFDDGLVISKEEFEEYFANEVPFAPVVKNPIPDIAAFTGQTFNFQIPVATFFDRNPGDTLTYSIAGVNGALPGWLSFNSNTGVFSGKPWVGATGLVAIDVTVTDSTFLFAKDTFVIDVGRGFTGGQAALFENTSINGTNGFWLSEGSGSSWGKFANGVGDINHDGVGDFVTWEQTEREAAVYFGSRIGFGQSLSPDTRNGYDGTTLINLPPSLYSMNFAIGDVNVDGNDDAIISFPNTSNVSRVVLGHAGKFEATTDFGALPLLSSFAPLAPGDGPQVGKLPNLVGATGYQTWAVGDVNGDEISDFVLRSSSTSPVVPVVYGLDPISSRTVNLNAMGASDGFEINLFPYEGFPASASAYSYSNWLTDVSNIGDINNDGLDDIALASSPYLFRSQSVFTAVILGSPNGHGGSVNLDSLQGPDGFLAVLPSDLTGHTSPNKTTELGDINGDGIDDVAINGNILGSRSNYVIYGRPNFNNVVQLGTLGNEVVDVPFVADAQYRGRGGASTYNLRGAFGSNGGRASIRGSDGAADRFVLTPGGWGGRSLAISDLSKLGARNTMVIPTSFNIGGFRLHLGSLALDLGTSLPIIHLEDFDQENVLNGPRTIDFFEFADGTVVSYEELISRGFDIDGSGYSEFLKGTSIVDRISGFGGDDLLDGGAGADTLIGGLGDDEYVVDNAADLVIESADEGSDTIKSSVSWTVGAAVEHLSLTGTTAINATGNAADNTLIGNGAINTLTGGLGNDEYGVQNATDVIVENVGEGTDTVRSSVSFALPANVENLTLVGTVAINGTGNTLTNTLVGNVAANTLDGGVGADVLLGGAGDDRYLVDTSGESVAELVNEGIDTVQSSVTWTLSANVENLILMTGALNGVGNALDNTLIGNTGSNTLSGSAGNDVYVVQDATDVAIENPSEGIDTVQSTVAWTLAVNLENLSLGAGAINGTGNGLGNTLTGGAGANTLSGGAGDDVYVIQDVSDVVIENAAEGTDHIRSAVNHTLGANVENLTLTGGAVTGTGNSESNTLTDASNPGLVNTLIGGLGNDIYFLLDSGDVVTEEVSAGTDEVRSSASYTLSANLENLTLTGTVNISGAGNTLVNIVVGNAGANTLDGGTGADTLMGSAGNDFYFVDDALDVVMENASEGIDTVSSNVSYTLNDANVENLIITGTAATAIGNASSNTLTDANASAGTVNTLIGGLGDDTYVVQTAGDIVTELSNEGIDEIRSNVTFTLANQVEKLTLTGAAAINATGNTLDNTLTGNTGNNVLTGGAGNDVYVVQNTGDTVVESAGEGNDSVNSSVTFTLAANVENLTLAGASVINATGNTSDNTLTGNSTNNVLTGLTGNDTYIIQNSGDTVVEGASAGTDAVLSSVSYSLATNVENLTLTGAANQNATGNASANTLVGNSGINTLDGGAAIDTLIGGAGNDVYVVDASGDTVIENANEGADTVQSGVSFTLGSNVEHLVLGAGALSGTGNGLDNTLNGGTGTNTLTGGAGNDLYIVQDATDVVVENVNEGLDTVQSTVSWTLGSNVEHLLLGGGVINGTGNVLDNTLTGGAGTNTLAGDAGNDVYLVQDGTDVVIENAGQGTDEIRSTVSYALGVNIENLTLTLTGNAALGVGNTLANVIVGNSDSGK